MPGPRLLALAVVPAAMLLTGCRDAPPARDPAPPADQGWTDLFDGRTLDGWTRQNGAATFRVEDGAIVGRTREGSPNSFLATEATFGDFELELDVRVDPELNSGIQIRSRTRERSAGAVPDEQAGRVFGPQVEVEASGSDGGRAGYIYGEATGLGWLTPAARLAPHRAFRDDDWNRYRIVARGPRIRTFINGEPIDDLTHEGIHASHPSGFIGLQVHGIPAGTGPYEVRWRNIRIRKLDP